MLAGYGRADNDAEEETDRLRESHSTTRLQDWTEDRARMAYRRYGLTTGRDFEDLDHKA